MEDNLKKIVAPVKVQEGKKPYWMNIGIMGIKNGKVWMRFNAVPTGWDGYCMAVEMDHKKSDDGAAAELPDTESGPGF